MKRILILGIAVLLCSTPAFAQSAKDAVQVSSLNRVDWTADNNNWETIFGNVNMFGPGALRIQTSQQKDLIFGVSLECGLFTQTEVKSKGGSRDTSTAEAVIQVRVVVDPTQDGDNPGGRTADPGHVTFCDRYQELSALLQGIIDLACVAEGACDESDLTFEEIELIQRTLNANAFFYALDDMGSGTHNVIVQARITSPNVTSGNGSASAMALIGKGAVTVEEVRLVKGTDIDLAP